jgi:hypothetical protein
MATPVDQCEMSCGGSGLDGPLSLSLLHVKSRLEPTTHREGPFLARSISSTSLTLIRCGPEKLVDGQYSPQWRRKAPLEKKS